MNDQQIKNEIDRDFYNDHWFRTIKEISPKTKLELEQLRSDWTFDSNAQHDFESRNISFHKKIVKIESMGSWDLRIIADFINRLLC